MLVCTPMFAFGGGLAGHLISRRTALELDRWRKREETMRMLRWAVELATEASPERRDAGLVSLRALLRSPLLDVQDRALVSSLTRHAARGSMEP